VSADPERNVLSIHFRGAVTPADTAVHVPAVETALQGLRRNFTLVSDLTGLETMDLDCVRHITRSMDLCLEAGVGSVVRIIPDPNKDIGFMLLSAVHYRGKVPIATRASWAEAQQELTRLP
jgi:hypothetical protein